VEAGLFSRTKNDVGIIIVIQRGLPLGLPCLLRISWGQRHRDEALADPGLLGRVLRHAGRDLESLPVPHAAAIPTDAEPMSSLLAVLDEAAGHVDLDRHVRHLGGVGHLEAAVCQDVY